jgi:GxxExxY protein
VFSSLKEKTNEEIEKRQFYVFLFLLPCIQCFPWLQGIDMDLIFKDETYAIRGAVYEVYREMGCGFLESVYQECLERELKNQSIPFISQQELKLNYKGNELIQTYKPDLICYEKIIIELKAVKALLPEHKAQIMNYLKAAKLKLGLLVNFGSYPKAQIERFVI